MDIVEQLEGISKKVIQNHTESINYKKTLHIESRINKNSIVASLSRYPLFSASTRSSTNTKKAIDISIDDGKSLSINKRLHQRHLDLLMLLFNESNKHIGSDGCLYVHTSWYKLAKSMGYKSATGAATVVSSYANDLQEVIISHDNLMNVRSKFGIIRKSYTDLNSQDTIVVFESDFLELFAYDVVYRLLNENLDKVINIKDGEIKAVIRYFMTHNTMKNGMHFDTLANKLARDETKQMKSALWNKIKKHKEILEDMGIDIEEDAKKIYYTKKSDVVQTDARKFNDSKIIIDILSKHLNSYYNSTYEFKVDGRLSRCKLKSIEMVIDDDVIFGAKLFVNYLDIEHELNIDFVGSKMEDSTNFDKFEYIFRLLAERLVEDSDKYDIGNSLEI
jgi:hypothetical protein